MNELRDRSQRRWSSGGPMEIARLFCLFIFAYIFSVSVFPAICNAENTVEVKGIRHSSTSEYLRVVVELSSPAEFSKSALSNPERLFFDLKNAKLAKGIQPNLHVGDKLLKMIRIGQYNANTVRVVLDLESADYDFKVFSMDDPPRLVIEIFSKGGGVEQKPDKRTEARSTQKRIVLDAGHGGHDPGAVGPNGLYEKDVVLDVALRARDIIKREYPFYDVILTRDRDVFIPLRERAEIANKSNADLFVSIHANASPNNKARGIETYLLNWTDDAEALRVAARENDISIKKMKEVQSETSLILASLERESKRDESVKIAGYVQNALAANITPQYPKVVNLGVKQALFYVLVGARMPSALVEVSFLSNREEERLLLDGEYRQKLADSIASGINGYFSSAPPSKLVSAPVRYKTGYNIRPAKYTRRK